MIRILTKLILVWLVFFAAGCGGAKEPEPIWERVKIGDLASSGGEGIKDRLLKTISFDVYSFKIPKEQTGVLDEISGLLYTEPIRFKGEKIFRANLFSAGIGQMGVWDKVGELLRGAGSKRIERDSLLLSDGESGYITVSKLYEKGTVFYSLADGTAEGVPIGRGGIVLEIKAERIVGSRGVSSVSAVPVFLPRAGRVVRRTGDGSGLSEFVFEGCGFEVKMSPGEFIFLGPSRYVSDKKTLGGMFFSTGEREVVFSDERGRRITGREAGAVKVYLLVCMNIID